MVRCWILQTTDKKTTETNGTTNCRLAAIPGPTPTVRGRRPRDTMVFTPLERRTHDTGTVTSSVSPVSLPRRANKHSAIGLPRQASCQIHESLNFKPALPFDLSLHKAPTPQKYGFEISGRCHGHVTQWKSVTNFISRLFSVFVVRQMHQNQQAERYYHFGHFLTNEPENELSKLPLNSSFCAMTGESKSR